MAQSLYERLGGYWKGHRTDSRRRGRQLIVNYMCEAADGIKSRTVQQAVPWPPGDQQYQSPR
jgi:hypothetical protein